MNVEQDNDIVRVEGYFGSYKLIKLRFVRGHVYSLLQPNSGQKMNLFLEDGEVIKFTDSYDLGLIIENYMSSEAFLLKEVRPKEIKAIDSLIDTLGQMGFDKTAFCEILEDESRSFQNAFTMLCLNWLVTCASNDYKYDGRNEYAHVVAKELLQSNDMESLYNLYMNKV